MTEEEVKKQSIISAIYGSLGGLIICIVGIVLTAFINDGSETKEKLDKKADIEYVDKKDQDTKEELYKVINSQSTDIREIRQDTKEILLLLNERR